MLYSTAIFAINWVNSMNSIDFHSEDLKTAYEEVREVLATPLYDIKQVEADIKVVEEFLRNSKVTSFMIGVENGIYSSYFKDCKIPMLWDGELKFATDSYGFVSIHTGTEEAKYECHKQLPKILKAAKEKMKEEIKENSNK
jgi:hypothetical protein